MAEEGASGRQTLVVHVRDGMWWTPGGRRGEIERMRALRRHPNQGPEREGGRGVDGSVEKEPAAPDVAAPVDTEAPLKSSPTFPAQRFL